MRQRKRKMGKRRKRDKQKNPKRRLQSREGRREGQRMDQEEGGRRKTIFPHCPTPAPPQPSVEELLRNGRREEGAEIGKVTR